MSKELKANLWTVSFLAAAAFVLLVAASTSTSAYFTETDIPQNSVSKWMSAEGEYEIRVDEVFGGASVTVETEIKGTGGDVLDVGALALVGIESDTGWVSVSLGAGRYRLRVTLGDGTTAVRFHGRRVSH